MAAAALGQLNLDEVPLWPWGPRGIDCFQKLEQIGQGTHGQVFKAKEIETGEIVAVKKIIMINEIQGLPIPAIREIKILKKLDHQNVIRLKEIVTSPGPERDEQGRPVDGNKYKGGIYMVFEYMDHDLAGLSKRPSNQFSLPQIKFYMRQLLTGLLYCHDNKVLHRDINGANLLIDNKGNLKLADFGMARFFSGEQDEQDKSLIFLTGKKDEILTDGVITRWYRPPELLLGSTKYGPEVDVWSVGCVFSELLLGKPIFPGEDKPDQLKKIFEICGTPDENNWPGVTELLRYNNAMVQQHPIERRIREVFKYFDHYEVDLLDKMLTLDPKKRISEKDALDAEYFSTNPLPCGYQPIHGSQPPMAASGPSHRYDEPARPSGGPNWYQQGGSASQGSSYRRGRYPSRGRSPPSYGGRRGRSSYGGRRGRSRFGGPYYCGRRGRSSYGGRRGRGRSGGPYYHQGGWYGSSRVGRGRSNTWRRQRR